MVKKIAHTLVVAFAAVGFVACASVKVVPLSPDGKKAENQEPGVRYYLPAPYLLVAELPPTLAAANEKSKPTGDQSSDTSTQEKGLTDSQTSSTAKTGVSAPSRAGGGGAGTGGTSGSQKDAGSDTGNSGAGANAASAPVSDTSFQAGTPQYMIKLIYLPDLAHPMAMTASSGLFGTAAMKPTLQDGWMLTALDSSADNKVAEVLTAVGSIIGAATGAGGSKASGGTKSTSADASFKGTEKAVSPPRPILRPGLYRFDYADTGVLNGLIPVTLFGGCKNLPKPKLKDGKTDVPCLEEIPLGLE